MPILKITELLVGGSNIILARKRNLLVTLHSVNPPTARGLPVATLINLLPDSDHFHSCLSDPVNDHNSSLMAVRVVKEIRKGA